MDVLDRTDLPFPQSLPEFQRLFSDDAACAAYLERARWGDGFACPRCGVGVNLSASPRGLAPDLSRLRCDGIDVGTVMNHTPFTWFWASRQPEGAGRWFRGALD